MSTRQPSLLRHPPFALLLFSRILANVGFAMLGVAVGWQLYTLTGSALDLGLVGLAQFVPMVVLTLVVGQVADRCDRRLVAAFCETVRFRSRNRSTWYAESLRHSTTRTGRTSCIATSNPRT